MMRLLLSLLLLLSFLQMNAQTYPKVILPGDYPDPSIMRDGKDYYMTHSPFYYAPGFLIWHSQDLMNWEPLCRVMPQYEGSAMAPDLLKYKDTYYIYYPAAGTNWVMWAKDIRGPWSLPVDLKVGGIDPGHVVDREGNRYLYVDKGEVIRLTEDGLATVGEKKKVYDGWKYPDHWDTECMCLESPKLNEHNGYYYLTSAQGGTAGPATSHMVVSARSKSVTGPWENSPYNPIVHTYSATDSWWSKGHGTLIDDVNGNWWIVYHAYANGYHTLGRSTLIEPIEWTEDGWYRTVSAATPVTPEQEIKHGLELSDDFKGPQLGLQWTFWKEYAPKSLTFKEDILWMKAKGRTSADGRVLLTTAEDKNYETQVEIRTGNGNVAGLILYYNEKAYAGVVSDGKRFYIYRNAEHKTELPNRIGKHFFARLHNCGNRLSVEVSKDGEEWTVLASDMDVSSLHHNNYGGFYALRVGLFSAGKGSSGFSRFRYRNAVPREKDMSAYLMVFHKDEDHGLHMAISPDGYTFTALNEGKPVIAGDTIAEQKGIRDPHIFRGPDGAFYLSMTDLHIYAQRDGYRDTEWERDGKEYGWGNNRGLVLMKSWDLIHWKRTNLRFDKLSAAYSEVGCAWAPEVTYDDKKGKLMMYFTMRFKNEANKLYYVYVNDDFDKLETLPQLLFQYPDEKISAIDADITRIEDKYHMFYVSHDGGAGIKQAVSDRVNSDYEYNARWYDPEPTACEAPNFRNETLALTDYLQAKKIAYAFIDFNMEEANALTYIGQDSYKSGYIAAKILMRNYQAGEGQELVLFLSNNKNSPAEIQMQRRLAGFMSFITKEYEELVIHEVVLNKSNQENNQKTLDEFFRLHPKATLGVVFNSRVYQLGEYLRSAGRSMKGLIGYDLLKANVELLKSGDVHYLIGQRPGLQGYCGVKALCDHVVFKKSVEPVKYMPIDIMIKENIDFYFEFV